MKKNLLAILFVFLASPAFAQELSQQLFGSVRNTETLYPIAEAQLVLSGGGNTYQAISDSLGNYRFKGVLPGRYQLQVWHVAYERKLIPEIQVKASRPEILRIYLQEREFMLQEAEIRSSGPGEIPENINQNLFTIEETQRFPATHFDPARLVRSQPGIVAANDQTNLISVHGQSPNHVGWQIEGVEILSPNHLPNAGTRSDRSTVSGGGVNILSGQLMDNSSFYTGSIPVSMGNYVGGMFDINLRPGSRSQRSHTLQASLLGIDLATEGPLQEGSNTSYLVNYRYSTVGLLSHMGVNFGNEEIQYQDLSFHLNWTETALGQLSFFGFGGLSSNYLSRQEEPAIWETDKDGQIVDFRSGMGAIGLNQRISLGGRSSIRNGFVYSARFSNRSGETFSPDLIAYESTNEDIRQELFALKSTLSLQYSTNFSAEIGLAANYYRNTLQAVPGNIAPFISLDHTLSYMSLQPFAELRYNWSPNWFLNPGIRLQFDSQNEKVYAEPRLELLRRLSAGSNLQFSYSLLSQPTLNQPHLMPALFIGDDNSRSLEPVRSHYTAVGYENNWGGRTLLKTKAYYQYFSQAPVGVLNGSSSQASIMNQSFSALNVVEEYALWPLVNEGRGRIYGLDASVQRYFTGDFYYLVGFSLFDATYKDAAGVRRNMRFNSRHNINLTAGKEWAAYKEDYRRIWGVHIRSLYHGGHWYTPVDEKASARAGTTMPDYGRAYEERLPRYFTFDIRLSHTREKEKYQRIWSIDIQNVLNRQNIGWYYYDQLLEQVQPAYQLGIIPVLAYRIEF